MEKFGISQPVRRREDVRFITGAGRFNADHNLDGQAHIFYLRSPHAHARINSIELAAARSAPGIVAIFTGDDLIADKLEPLPFQGDVETRTGEPMFRPPRHALAVGHVRHVGEPVAMVIAENLDQAHDAADLIEIDYQALPAVTDTAGAVEPDAPTVWPEAPDNLCAHWQNRDFAELDSIFAAAPKIAEVHIVNNRVVGCPMEPRNALAEYDAEADVITLYSPTQGVHRVHDYLTKLVFKVAAENIRVVSFDVGGGFGLRGRVSVEVVSIMWAAKKLGRALKWSGERSESFFADSHGRDNVTHAKLAMDQDGKALALYIDTIANMGAYLSISGPRVPTWNGQRITGTAYAIPVLYQSVRLAFTNTTPTDTYRGAGRPEAAYVMERLMEAAADVIGVDSAEIRRRNLIATSALPYTNTQDIVIDSGDFVDTQGKAMAKAGWDGIEARRAEAKARGKLRGIGIGFFMESSGGQPAEQVEVSVGDEGRIEALVGTFSHGQGHETVFAQVVSEKMGVPYDDVTIIQGGADTSLMSFGGGTHGSRSSQMGGVALVRACAMVIEKGKVIAGHLLQAGDAKVEYEAGVFRAAAGTITIAEVAQASQDPDKLPEGTDPGLKEEYFYKRANKEFNFPNGCHIAEVEIDPDTGIVEVVNYTAVDDSGIVLNPMIVHGQAHGGIAQGIGQALMERTVYDETGQLLTATFMDYTMPRADDFPDFNVSDNPIPSPNDLGVKGAGEGGCCGAPSAVVNAVIDALKGLGVRHVDMPLTPELTWRIIREAQSQGAH
ncbi:MAG: xanthine dehydrogenase family protein molybdopterin-binding subunit [Alphaproteobacteria bacterium]